MDDQKELDRLRAEYREKGENLTQREKAQFEANIWRLMKSLIGPGVTKEYEKRDWLQAEFGGRTTEYDGRAQLWNYGTWADLLWKRIDDHSLSLHTAILISRRVKQIASNSGESLVAVLSKELEFYDSRGRRRGRPRKTDRVAPPVSRSTKPVPAPTSSTDFMLEARDLVDALAADALPNIDEYVVSALTTDLLEWIKQGLDEFRKKAYFQRGEAKREKLVKIGATRFRQACEVLALKAAFGKPLDKAKLRKCYVTRVGPLHPDKNNGSHATQHEYEAVVDAYRLLSDYLEQMKEE